MEKGTIEMMFKPTQQLREYQREALEFALQREGSVCVLPTGTGKTLVGLAWTCELLNSGSVRRVLVLEPSRYLVEQVHKYYRDNSNLHGVNKVYGVEPREERRAEWGKGAVVVSTPHSAYNDREWLDFDAVVVDECHHTVGDHAFAKLLQGYRFARRLGLSATIPRRLEQSLERMIGEIRRWPWENLKKRYPEFIPDWIGEVYDAEMTDEEAELVKLLEEVREQFSGPLAGLPGLAIRMLTKDGALALAETLDRGTIMSGLLGPLIRERLGLLRSLHKIDQAKAVLEEHDFTKAILFTDRVVVARRLLEAFKNYNPMLLLGRLRSSQREQEEAVRLAADPSVRLIIATSVGEEGVDLPAADLLVVWSNVASSLRFIQRLGRVMRPGEKLRVAAFIATPETPDYDSLLDGLVAAKMEGVDIEGISEDLIKQVKTRSFKERVRRLLEEGPLRYGEIAVCLKQPKSTVNRWLREGVKEKDMEYRLFYFYEFPETFGATVTEEWHRHFTGREAYFKHGRWLRFFANIFGKVSKENRYYASVLEADNVEIEFGRLFADLEQQKLPLDFQIRSADRRLLFQGRINPQLVLIERWYLGEGPFGMSMHDLVDHILGKFGDSLLRIRFFWGGTDFFPTVEYDGIFTRKTLELTLRNALYLAERFRSELEKAESASARGTFDAKTNQEQG